MSRNKYPEETVRLILDKSLKLFVEKGYEATSIQDIINSLGGLSKGAIYHHFKSKEEIFEAALDKVGYENLSVYENIINDKTMSGIEKLRAIFKYSSNSYMNDAMLAVAPSVAKDAKMVMSLINDSLTIAAPKCIEPIIMQCISEGSVKTDYPHELSEVMILLLNFWINPFLLKSSIEETKRKILFIREWLLSYGLDVVDGETLNNIMSMLSKKK